MTMFAVLGLALSAIVAAVFALGRRRVAFTTAGALALGCATLAALPLASVAVLPDGDVKAPTAEAVAPPTAAPTPSADVEQAVEKAVTQAPAPAQAAAPAPTPKAVTGPSTRQVPNYVTTPPLHGTNPHGQGTVAVVDVAPDPTRPYEDGIDGEETDEEIIVGRARGEEQNPNEYHGQITILALFGNQILGVETQEGETRQGPLEPVQNTVLDPICEGTTVCLEVLTAESTTTDTGSFNRFGVAKARIGDKDQIKLGVAESQGKINREGDCQISEGSSSVADAEIAGQPIASLATSRSYVKACKGQGEAEKKASGHVLTLFGTPVPIPAEGCGEGEPDVVVEIPVVATIVCNATDIRGVSEATTQATDPYVARDALIVYALATETGALASTTLGASDALAKAPAAACNDGVDNDGDGKVDFPADPGCTSPSDDSELDETRAPVGGAGGEGGQDRGDAEGDVEAATRPACSDGIDNDNDGEVDFPADEGCTSRTDDSEANVAVAAGGAPACSDGRDNDGDGKVDFPADPGCLSASDESEENAAAATAGLAGDDLPFSGAELLWTAMAGLGLMAGGLVLRRRQVGG